jgi:hypothetical protein
LNTASGLLRDEQHSIMAISTKITHASIQFPHAS